MQDAAVTQVNETHSKINVQMLCLFSDSCLSLLNCCSNCILKIAWGKNVQDRIVLGLARPIAHHWLPLISAAAAAPTDP